MLFSKGQLEGTKAFFDAFRTPALLVVVAVVFTWPWILFDFADRAGFKIDAIKMLGFEAVAKKASDNLDATAAQLSDVTSALAERNQLLSQVSEHINNPDLKRKIEELTNSGNKLVHSGEVTASVATRQAAAAQTNLQNLSPASPSADILGSSLFVFGADADVKSALDEIRKARNALTGSDISIALFKKGSFYRSAAVFPNDESRNANFKRIEQAVNRSGTRVPLATWCPAARKVEDAMTGVPVYQC